MGNGHEWIYVICIKLTFLNTIYKIGSSVVLENHTIHTLLNEKVYCIKPKLRMIDIFCYRFAAVDSLSHIFEYNILCINAIMFYPDNNAAF